MERKKVKRILIENEDGEIVYDNKPDLMICYVANNKGDNASISFFTEANADKVTTEMTADAIKQLDDTRKQLTAIEVILRVENLTKLIKGE